MMRPARPPESTGLNARQSSSSSPSAAMLARMPGPPSQSRRVCPRSTRASTTAGSGTESAPTTTTSATLRAAARASAGADSAVKTIVGTAASVNSDVAKSRSRLEVITAIGGGGRSPRTAA